MIAGLLPTLPPDPIRGRLVADPGVNERITDPESGRSSCDQCSGPSLLPCPRIGSVLPEDLSAGLAMLSILTTRERAILSMLAEGMDNRTMARHLGICETTVKTHMTAILAKLGLTSRLQAGLVAFVACFAGLL
jgi:DNA-binding NarL/FixJ family response regulator